MLEYVAARALPGYRYTHAYISDLGRPDSPLSYVMNTAFVVQGSLFLAGTVLLVRATRSGPGGWFVGCAAANAIGNVVIAAVPSGPAGIGWLHVGGAVLAIVGGNTAILAGHPLVSAARWYRFSSIGIATVGLASFVVLAAATGAVPTVLPAAVWERTSVYTIIGWQMLSALQLLRGERD